MGPSRNREGDEMTDSSEESLTSSSDESMVAAAAAKSTPESNPRNRGSTSRHTVHACDVPGCDYVTDRKNNLSRHRKSMHDNQGKIYECCGILFYNKAEFRKHTKEVHKTQGYPCKECKHRFDRKALLKRHMTVHTGVKPYSCLNCKYATSHKSNLTRHCSKKGHRCDLNACSSRASSSRASMSSSSDPTESENPQPAEANENAPLDLSCSPSKKKKAEHTVLRHKGVRKYLMHRAETDDSAREMQSNARDEPELQIPSVNPSQHFFRNLPLPTRSPFQYIPNDQQRMPFNILPRPTYYPNLHPHEESLQRFRFMNPVPNVSNVSMYDFHQYSHYYPPLLSPGYFQFQPPSETVARYSSETRIHPIPPSRPVEIPLLTPLSNYQNRPNNLLDLSPPRTSEKRSHAEVFASVPPVCHHECSCPACKRKFPGHAYLKAHTMICNPVVNLSASVVNLMMTKQQEKERAKNNTDEGVAEIKRENELLNL